jgi:hypothetical protein
VGIRATTSISSLRTPSFHRGALALLTPVALSLLVAPYLGMLWEWVTPAPTYINLDGAIYLENQDTTKFIAADTWFLCLGLIAGMIAGGLGYWRYRRRFVPMIGLTVSGLLGALIARRVGVAFGPPPVGLAAIGLPEGEITHAMIELRAQAVVLAWPVGVLLSYVCCIGGLERAPTPPSTSWATEAEANQPAARPARRFGSSKARTGYVKRAFSMGAGSVGAGGAPDEVGGRNGRKSTEDAPLPAEQREFGA